MEENADNTNPKFGNFNKNNPFQIPEAYFESFPEKLLNRIELEELSKQSKIIKMLKPLLSVAALFAIILGAWFLILKNIHFATDTNVTNQTEDTYETIQLFSMNENSILEYFMENESTSDESILLSEDIEEYLSYKSDEYLIYEEY